MVKLSSFTIDELLNELTSRDGIYYESGAKVYDDPVLNPTYGVIHIYDMREYINEMENEP